MIISSYLPKTKPIEFTKPKGYLTKTPINKERKPQIKTTVLIVKGTEPVIGVLNSPKKTALKSLIKYKRVIKAVIIATTASNR